MSRVHFVLFVLALGTQSASGAEPSPTPSPVMTPSPVPTGAPSPMPSVTPAVQDFAEIVPGRAAESIQLLKWKNTTAPVRTTTKGDDTTYEVVLEGDFKRPDWELILGSKLVELGQDRTFQLPIEIQGKTVTVLLHAIGPRGEMESQEVKVLFKGWKEYVARNKKDPSKRWFYNAGLSLTSIAYSETGTQDYSSISTTLRGGMRFVIVPPLWDASLTGYFTLLPITRNRDEAARFLGVNARVGYTLPSIKAPWSITLMGGLYYTRMYVQGEAFGFTNMAGPQLYPTIRRQLTIRDSISGYAKYSPVASKLSLLSLGNREFAIGGFYTRTLANGHQISATVDLASFQLYIDRSEIKSTSLSVGATYGF